MDVDTLHVNETIRGIVARHGLFNNRVTVYLDQLPYNFEDRLQELNLGTDYVAYLSPCNEDLAVMKLYAWRDTDIEDLCNPRFVRQLDWELLEHLVYMEAPMSRAGDPDKDQRYQEMINTYEHYKDLCEEGV